MMNVIRFLPGANVACTGTFCCSTSSFAAYILSSQDWSVWYERVDMFAAGMRK